MGCGFEFLLSLLSHQQEFLVSWIPKLGYQGQQASRTGGSSDTELRSPRLMEPQEGDLEGGVIY